MKADISVNETLPSFNTILLRTCNKLQIEKIEYDLLSNEQILMLVW